MSTKSAGGSLLRGGPAGEADVADRVVADLHQYGTPYLAARSTLPDIIAAMSAAGTTQLGDTYLAIAHALLGDLPEARQALAAVARKGGNQAGPGAR
ncbi:hypothetical protein [Phytohabitans houttuyneae]|uniref:Uncharacterized protein n=1 Tax=Phytohabitans houttuyneae TaxID=1076126 RepID=A0A6V8KEJ1_9ACTN|nr:hypothetical protein [Phytohabitans houttuyneae]GFJ83612.1 hypothetical protein Phou_077920 [Phytohabitans houttuyneae]